MIALFACLSALPVPQGLGGLWAQGVTLVEGWVCDSLTGDPLEGATVVAEASGVGAASDSAGFFRLGIVPGDSLLRVRALGYEERCLPLPAPFPSFLAIRLSPATYGLEGVEVRPRRYRYTHRDNPAVALARRVIAHKQENNPRARGDFRLPLYERLSLSTGDPPLTLSVREARGEYAFGAKAEGDTFRVHTARHRGLDRGLDADRTLSRNLEELFPFVDIYRNELSLVLSRFSGPLAVFMSNIHYKYFLSDTLTLDGEPCAGLAFVPFAGEAYAFSGRMYITLDGRWSVKKISLEVPRRLGLNWVDGLRIDQEFERDESGAMVLLREDLYALFSPFPNTPQLRVHRLRRFRELPLEETEEASEAYYDRLLRRRSVRHGLRVVEALVSDYLPTRSSFGESRLDFGPLSSVFSANSAEGFRMRWGGMTTAVLHPRLLFSGYLAYGWGDARLKYEASAIWNFAPRRYHEKEYPMHYLSFTQRFEADYPGRGNAFSSADHLLQSFSASQTPLLMQYVLRSELKYEREWGHNLSWVLRLRRERSRPGPGLSYRQGLLGGSTLEVDQLTVSELGLQLRYAPGEKPYDSRRGRRTPLNLSRDVPVFTFTYRLGLPLGGGTYRYHYTGAAMDARFHLGALGYLDVLFRADAYWNPLPFPLLHIPETNPGFFLRPGAFVLMQPLEYVADRAVSLFLTHNFRGLLLHRIPWIRRLSLREVVVFNTSLARLSDFNNPLLHPEGLFHFPAISSAPSLAPYMELGFGLDNLFRIFRLDYYFRLTPSVAPRFPTSGVRLSFRFSF
jgi:hypothetical protein